MRKLKLDPDALRVDSFDPAEPEGGEGTVFGGQIAPTQLSCAGTCVTCAASCFTCQLSCNQTCGRSCFLTCQFTCNRTCFGATCELSCNLTCGATCVTCGYTCDPILCDGPTGVVCA